ncbi:MAG: bifunctional 2-C-methyl-D-erythritol 4-phosphate cytidylyltransferase/2-C-methyl-D-erythritol 2,4-cyclodiphosphate synthase [Novosphingobium sp. 17-62-19]|uniref:bifunctional 2-C-methyl-D-erythritol 4-phosphate cytidylyltransferase/2-C-methyl-D-erythritol 2,4-cyclodiphosphate synthase n=1 Tax=Novosphingobium sp. 17-62-19 TaxID=1970406 RepID=UPI000BD06A64|nr:bifunctional 2-C-methyl-D-erythritol 4-phosphate cytidylyltransferase/2-C-methyl-D-erythritol 2,4-cyclodiphosphate synthase [Novosphingobium sp. 17-62-19]OYX92906.1 MAG: bifunctional 2-C-methyl-D-erythritol 4-phosphate cytidylyltransferase/2-C-methyl-D-erythritol 2,4-cyclodiphosphate synthase [Novosphingobium sp. 35-62-5]OZA17896.1 MAG: bifunctional 2-C-methyl-D-erythritol 4-phosphate cytidylyltransferase/2-C-methyl-D-erythritol 2,4-cyclodiphosphate synthase [Novosphingobium sp. 17-62-19]HQS9
MNASQSLGQTQIAAIVVAAGKGLRTGGVLPKQFVIWRGKPLLRHSVEALLEAGIDPVVVAIPDGWEAVAADALAGLSPVRFVVGGATRQESVRVALEALEADAPAKVLIHDAARPVLPRAVINGLLGALDGALGAVPVLPVVDSMVRGAEGAILHPVTREELYRVQTPQAFDYAAILAAHRAWASAPEAGDDAQVAMAAGHDVLLIDGDEALRKVTFAADLEEQAMGGQVRTGMGFDVHRLVDGEELWLCGVKIPHDKGLSGHSDADVAIHALVDALLGAIAAGDIGDHFPPSDPQWKGASSDRFLAHAASLVRAAGFDISNVDVTVICEAPKIGPHKAVMRGALARILGIDLGAVSVKATTTERLGLTGRGEGIAAQAVATVHAR